MGYDYGYYANAVDVVREAGAAILEGFGKRLELSRSGDRGGQDTFYDLISLLIICHGLKKHYPGDGLMAEGLQEPKKPGKIDSKEIIEKSLNIDIDNHGVSPGKSRKIWVIDPICGTIPFAHGIRDFIVSAAHIELDGDYEYGTSKFKIIAGIVFDPAHDELFFAKRGRGSVLNGESIEASDTKLEDLEQGLENPEKGKVGMISIEHKMIRECKDRPKVIGLSNEFGRLRVAGTCGLELAYVACGRLDAALKAGQPLYDYAAGLIIVEETGKAEQPGKDKLTGKGIITDFDGNALVPKLSYKKKKEGVDILASNGKIHKFITKHWK